MPDTVPVSEPLYTAAQTRALDRCAIDDHGIPGIRLMDRAARATFDLLLECWPEPAALHVYCGTGNNGGDGFLVACLARRKGIPATVYQLGEVDKIDGDAAIARRQAQVEGVAIVAFDDASAPRHGVIVDAMLGTGLGGDVRGPYQAAISAINRAHDDCGLPVLAVDIPSGLCSDTGRVLGCAVRADITVTFIGLKRGLLTLDASDHTGAVHFCDLEVPGEVYNEVPASAGRLTLEPLLQRLDPRSGNAHKGAFGRVLVIGGDSGMAGAAAMASQASARTGAGLVYAATRPEHVPALVARCPEVMTHGVTSGADLETLLQSADVVVIGPGLGQSTWSEQLLRVALTANRPTVVDADALNMLSEGRIIPAQPHDNWLLTPHPGEAARLLNCAISDIQADRFDAALRLQHRYGGVALLKGAGTVIATPEQLLLSDYGNPGMASGGMGDVLSGILGGLLAQGLGLAEAAALGTCLHGGAADIAAREGQRGLLATDLLAPLRQLLG